MSHRIENLVPGLGEEARLNHRGPRTTLVHCGLKCRCHLKTGITKQRAVLCLRDFPVGNAESWVAWGNAQGSIFPSPEEIVDPGPSTGFFFSGSREIRTWWRSGDVSAGDGLAQAFQEPFELGLAVLKPSHAPIQALHVLAHPGLQARFHLLHVLA